MNSKLITLPLLKIVEDLSFDKPAVQNKYSRVAAVLKKYAGSKGLKYSELRMFDIYSEDNTLQVKLMKFIARLEKPKKRTPLRHKSFKEEVLSNLNGLFILINKSNSKTSVEIANKSFLEENLPEILKPLISLLPRSGKSSTNKMMSGVKSLKHHSPTVKPLSESSKYMILALIEVFEKYQPSILEDLFSTYALDVRQVVKTSAPSKKWTSVFGLFHRIKGLLNFTNKNRVNRRLPLSEFPPTLKKQCELFMERAITGWADNPDVVSVAERNKINLNALERTTIKSYLQGIAFALPHIPYEKDLDIRDLLRLETVEIEIDNVTTTRFCNPFVDVFRIKEWKRQTPLKRIGYDSSIFSHFITGIKAVAAYNGIFHLHTDFRKSYSLNLDKESRKKRRTAKKQIFSLMWLDNVIEELEVDFIRIIKENRFKLDNPNFKRSELIKSLRFCLFYVSFVTLRYFGFRQQCLRNCTFFRNIVFHSDGSILFRWQPSEIKNDALLEISLEPNKHSMTHGRLIRVLTLYYQKVYKYLQKKDAKTIDNQFFLKLDRSNHASKFVAESTSDFYSKFINACRAFIKLEEVTNELVLSLNPHSLRGIAGDWLHNTLGLDIEKTAKILGDSRSTVENEYLRRDQHIVTPVLDEINLILSQREKQITVADSLLSAVQTDDLRRANERADLAENRLNFMFEQLNLANQQIAFLQNHLEQGSNHVLEEL